jgi:hypothetical protein
MTKARRRAARPKPAIGWREWVALPDLGVESIKAKVDTGARTSALHVFDLEVVARDGRDWARFEIHPVQDSAEAAVRAEAPIDEWREIKSSNGQVERRPVVVTRVGLMESEWPIEVTLTNRDEMGFRMLLGRQAVRRRFAVDPGRSYLAGTAKP